MHRSCGNGGPGAHADSSFSCVTLRPFSHAVRCRPALSSAPGESAPPDEKETGKGDLLPWRKEERDAALLPLRKVRGALLQGPHVDVVEKAARRGIGCPQVIFASPGIVAGTSPGPGTTLTALRSGHRPAAQQPHLAPRPARFARPRLARSPACALAWEHSFCLYAHL